MKSKVSMIFLILACGCASQAEPRFYYGNFFLVGDEHCQSVRKISETRIMCIDKHGNDMGYREAMTIEDINNWDQQQALAASEFRAGMQSLGQSVSEAGDAIQQQGQQTLDHRRQPTTTGTVSGWSSEGSGSMTYTRAGNSLIGSNGVSYRQVGDVVIGSDGTTCQVVGPNIICR